jgi:DNA-binding phage protein
VAEIKSRRETIFKEPKDIGRSTKIAKSRRPRMALTRKFKDTVQLRAAKDPKFRRALLTEAINELLSGDTDVAKSILRDYINATITFPVLAEKLKKDSKSLHRMFGPSGNPRMDSIVGVLKVLQTREKIKLHAKCC